MRIIPNQKDLDQMISKFIINLPSSQINEQRLWSHFQKCFFYFIDKVVDLQPLSDFQDQNKQRKQFFTCLANRLPSFLKLDSNKISKMINEGYDSTPIYGVIIINLEGTKVLLVQSHKPVGLFGFPKGKINQKQTPIQCAKRQVKEEVGINVDIDPQKKIQVIYSKSCTFFICQLEQQNINVKFVKNTQYLKNLQKQSANDRICKEIKSLAWVSIQQPNVKLNTATKKAFDKIQFEKNTKNFTNKQQSCKELKYKGIIKNPFDNYCLDMKKYRNLINY